MLPWLRDNRRFHFVITVPPDRSVFTGGTGGKLAQARDHIQKTLAQAEANRDGVGGGQHDERSGVAAFQLSQCHRKHNLPDRLRVCLMSDRNGIA